MEINKKGLKGIHELIRIASSEVRLKIIDYLQENPLSNITDITKVFGLKRITCYNHMQELLKGEFVKRTKPGPVEVFEVNTNVIYRLNDLIEAYQDSFEEKIQIYPGIQIPKEDRTFPQATGRINRSIDRV